MRNKKFKNGTAIKGSDLQGCFLCKVLSEDMVMRGFQYKIGMNEDVNPLVLEGSCKAGLHFVAVQDLCGFLDYGINLATVRIPEDEAVYVDKGKFRTHRLEIRSVLPLDEVSTWEFLVRNGADITAFDNYAVIWAAEKGYLEVMKYLHKNGVDITAGNNDVVIHAAKEGHLEAVEFLHKNGADITADNNYAVIQAAGQGHLEVVKYLYENGADITADRNCAVRWAARYGHLEMVKYLVENGADITVWNNEAIRMAANAGHLDVVTYLAESGADIGMLKL